MFECLNTHISANPQCNIKVHAYKNMFGTTTEIIFVTDQQVFSALLRYLISKHKLARYPHRGISE